MDLGIKGRKAIVCASSRGLGKACAQSLVREGCDIVINGLNADTLEKTRAELSELGNVVAIQADINTDAGRQALLAACTEPDILVNNNSGPPPGVFQQ